MTLNSGVYHFHRNLPLKVRIFGGTQDALRREVSSTLEKGLARVKLELQGDEVAVIKEEQAAP